MREEEYQYWLCQIKYLRRSSMRQLYVSFGNAEAVYKASEQELKRSHFLTEKEFELLRQARQDQQWELQWEQLQKREIQVFTIFHERFPKRLSDIYQPPKCLYVKGKLPKESGISLGIVGARNCTSYGKDMARMFAYRLAEQGVQIISGMAKGIDGWSHQGALEAGADTFAVLGTGVEVCYPTSHEALYRSIQRHGGVISELPVFTKAMPQFFPLRNRIISGLSHGILVVEAREKSGSLITADAALEQGKDVFVIPGRIGDELSEGCNRLIRQGAIPVLSPQDILEYYQIEAKEIETEESQLEKCLLACMHINPTHIDNIIARTNFSPTEVMKGLIDLQKKGKIEEVGRNYYRKKF